MPRIELAPALADDFDRILDHLARHDVEDSPERIRDLIEAITILGSSPSIGRPLKRGLREVVIGRRSRGYDVLYRFVPELDTVFVLAVRSQRGTGTK